MRTSFRAFVAVVAAVAAAPAALRAEPPDDARTVFAPPGAENGDADAVLDALVGVVERDREGPLAQAALNEARTWWPACSDPAPLVKRLEAVAARGIPQGDADEQLHRTLFERYTEAGDQGKRVSIRHDAGYLGDFLVVGPFGLPSPAALDQAYDPERTLDMEKEYAGREGPVRWVRYANLGIGEMIEPFQYLRPTDGVAYALAQGKSEASRPAVLKVTCTGPIKVFLNGVEAVRIDRLREVLPRTSWTPVTLAAGWNRILVKVVGNSAFMVKVCDADRGLPVAGLEFEKGRTLRPAAAALPAPAEVGYRSNLARVRAGAPSTPAGWTVRARIEDHYDMDWEAYADYQKAAEAAPKDPGVLYALAGFTEGFGELPQPRWRQNKARALYEDVLEQSPNHALAAVSLARMLHQEDRTEEALSGIREPVKLSEEKIADPAAAKAAAETRAAMERSRRVFPGLRKLLDEKPKFAYGWLVLAGFCQDRSWEKESEDAARRAAEICPRYPQAWGFLLRLADRQGNVVRAEEICRKMIAADHGSYGVRRRLANIRKQRGDYDACLAELSRISDENPADFSVRTERAGILSSLRRYDQAVAVVRELQALSPLEFDYPWSEGHYLRLKDDEEGAKKAWQRALALSPGRAPVRQALERMDGRDFDFARPYEEDAVRLWKECGGQDKYPKALAVHLLDLQVMRVNEDGSQSTITHNAYKILNERGREKYSEVAVPGWLLEVRAISPEGEEYFPIGAKGSSFTLEGLQAGWLVEYRYLRHEGRGDQGFDSGQWYFQDPSLSADADPVVLSRWVVDMPESLRAPLLLRNYGSKPEPKVENGRRVYRFEMRDKDRIEQEPSMPPVDEIVPWVHFYGAWSYDQLNLEYQRSLSSWRATPILRAKAEALLKGVQGNLARAEVLYRFVNEHVQGNSGGWGATGVLLEASGNRFALFASLLSAAGVPYDPVRVATGAEGVNRWEIVQPGLFDEDGIVLHGDDGREAYVFNFARHTPFGRLPEGVRGRPAMLPGPKGPTLFRMPDGDDADLEELNVVEVTLGAKPEDATFRFRLRNPNDSMYGFKERIKDANTDDRKKIATNMAGRVLQTPDVTEFSFPGYETYGEPFALTAAGGLPRQMRQEAGEMALPLGPPPRKMAETFVEKPDREWALVLQEDEVKRDVFTYDLAGKWRVKRLPAGHTAVGRLGTYSLTVAEEGGKVRVERRLRFGHCRYSVDEYREFVSWCKDIDSAEEQRIVLEAR